MFLSGKGIVFESEGKNGNAGLRVKFTNVHLPGGGDVVATVPDYLVEQAHELLGRNVNVTAHSGYKTEPEIDCIVGEPA